MSRMLTSSIVLGVWSLVLLSGQPRVQAQVPPGNAEVRQPRPPNAALQVQNLPPELDKLLLAWSQNSAKVQKLQGTHHRFVYDTVFNVEKRAEGVFYYEAPGKGRIDLKPKEIENGEQSGREITKGGPRFKLQSDRAERWICDGTDIWQVNDGAKQVDVFPIPQENQGQNIMDGPMPFLFGMPPEKAKIRYVLKLLQDNPQQAVIEVLPRLQVDAANWRKATVILDKAIFLPRAVQLIDPSGNLETVYTFGEFQINKPDPKGLIALFGGEDPNPFRPKLKGYAIKVHNGNEANAPQQPGQVVPSVAGLGWQDAKKLLEQLGCEVQPIQGQPAPEEKLTYVVYEQNPAAKSPLLPKQVVKLTVYDKPQPVPKGSVPAVSGLHWKDAGAKLEQAGYKVKYIPGQTAKAQEQIYIVYQQAPAAGKPLEPGGEVTLTVYNKIPGMGN